MKEPPKLKSVSLPNPKTDLSLDALDACTLRIAKVHSDLDSHEYIALMGAFSCLISTPNKAADLESARRRLAVLKWIIEGGDR